MPTAQTRCCPEPEDDYGGTPLTYITSAGLYFDTATNAWTTLTDYYWGGFRSVSELFNKCVRVQSIPSAYGPMYDPEACPCCPDGFVYVQNIVFGGLAQGTCVSINIPINTANPVPCIDCVCEDTTQTFECDSCTENGGQPIHFSYNPFVKKCTDCTQQEFEIPTNCKMNAFLPYFIILPNTNNFTTE